MKNKPQVKKGPTGPNRAELLETARLLNAEKFPALERHGRTLMARYPGHNLGWKLLGMARRRQGFYQDAITAYTKASEIDPDDHEAYNNLGIALRDDWQIGQAVGNHIRAIAKKPDYAEAHNALGTTLSAMGHQPAALQSYRKAIEINPDFAEPHNNLGNLLREADSLEAAIACYRNAIRAKPGYAEAYVNLGIAYKAQNEYEAAEQAFLQGLKLRPNLVLAYFNLASLLTDQGRVDEVLDLQRNGLRLLMTEVHVRQKVNPKKFMAQDSARQALKALNQAMEAEGIPYFLAFGTLLGIVRDGDLLPYDKDMDIGLPWDVDRDEVMTKLTENHGFMRPASFKPTDAQKEWNCVLVHPETKTSIDLFFFKPVENSLISGFCKDTLKMQWRFRHFEITEYHWLDEQWPVPKTPEAFLEDIYGPEWRTPDPYFDTVVSARNLEPESHALAIVYGYVRLIERMGRREWEKASKLCDQVRALQADPFIDELQSWLETVIERQKEAA